MKINKETKQYIDKKIKELMNELGYIQGYVPENMEDKMNCDWLNCMAGCGIAGHGGCFLNGKWWLKKCPMFKKEEDC